MSLPPTHEVVALPAEMRAIARRGEWRGSTGGQCPAYQQANLVILPKEAVAEAAAFCTRNPKPCPLIEITPPGDPEPARSGPGADIRTDLPGYRVYRHGQLVEKRGEIRELWRDDLVAFLLGCSLTFEHALIEAGVGVRNVEFSTLVPMFISSLACRPAGRFHGLQVVTMRPIPERQVQLACESARVFRPRQFAAVYAVNPRRGMRSSLVLGLSQVLGSACLFHVVAGWLKVRVDSSQSPRHDFAVIFGSPQRLPAKRR